MYYHKSKGLWDEFDALEAPYLCLCWCNCANGRIKFERDQRMRLIQFLMGLDEIYSNIRGHILLMQPLPTVAKAYTMVRQEKQQRKGIAPNWPSSIWQGATHKAIQFRTRLQKDCEQVMGQDETKKASTSGQNNAPPDTHVSARMEQLQNQLNQVLQILLGL
ncbi:hypothetical protein Tco_0999504 [Tanacetum coccineum]